MRHTKSKIASRKTTTQQQRRVLQASKTDAACDDDRVPLELGRALDNSTNNFEIAPTENNAVVAPGDVTSGDVVGRHADFVRLLDELPLPVKHALMRPALLKDESPEGHFELVCLLGTELQPRGVIDWLKIKELADYTYEIARYRRAERHIITNVEVQARYELIQRRLNERGIDRWDRELTLFWNRGVEELTKYMGVEDTAVDDSATIGESFVIRLPELERIARLRANAELRRDMIQRELEERRDNRTTPRVEARVRRSQTRIVQSASEEISVDVPISNKR